jgi:hypothetical protein
MKGLIIVSLCSLMYCVQPLVCIFFFLKRCMMDFYTCFLIDNKKYDGEVSLNNRTDFYSF